MGRNYPVRVSTDPNAQLHRDLAQAAGSRIAAQQPLWPDQAELQAAVAELASYPPLVFAGECDVMMTRMAAASQGEAFVLMGGDCAETFAGATANNIRDRIKTCPLYTSS